MNGNSLLIDCNDNNLLHNMHHLHIQQGMSNEFKPRNRMFNERADYTEQTNGNNLLFFGSSFLPQQNLNELSNNFNGHSQSVPVPHHQSHYNHNLILPSDNMWEDISASICDDFAVSVKSEIDQSSNSEEFSFRGSQLSLNPSITQNQNLNQHLSNSSHFTSPTPRQVNSTNNSNSPIFATTHPTNGNYHVTTPTTSQNIISNIHPSNRMLLYMPPTPPNSEPGSPSNQVLPNHVQPTQNHSSQLQTHQNLNHRRTPPPPYATTNGISLPNGTPMPTLMSMRINQSNHQHHHHHHHHHHHASVTENSSNLLSSQEIQFHSHQTRIDSRQSYQTQISPQAASPVVIQPQKYNRRNNPELEKRRIHHCDYPGKR